jgi:hypothetical protein
MVSKRRQSDESNELRNRSNQPQGLLNRLELIAWARYVRLSPRGDSFVAECIGELLCFTAPCGLYRTQLLRVLAQEVHRGLSKAEVQDAEIAPNIVRCRR